MKRRPKRLELSTKTVRVLTSDLSSVAGGTTVNKWCQIEASEWSCTFTLWSRCC